VYISLITGACPTLKDPANGKVIVVGQCAFYICNAGYVATGNPFNSCAGGKWISPPVMCTLP